MDSKATGSLDEGEPENPEGVAVGGFGLCAFGNQCDKRNWSKCRKVTNTLDIGAAASAVASRE